MQISKRVQRIDRKAPEYNIAVPATHHSEGSANISFNRLDESAVELRVILEPLYLGRGKVLLLIHLDLAQNLLRRASHDLHGHHPGRDDPCRCADKMIELFDI